MSWLVDVYLWLKALHIIVVIAWMAGMLYLPRLFVYHTKSASESEASEILKVMEQRLSHIIIIPAMIAALISGGLLLCVPGLIDWASTWIWVKLLLVLFMAGLYGLCSRWRSDFVADRNRHSEKFYRRVNEIPTVLLVGIVVLVVIKPF